MYNTKNTNFKQIDGKQMDIINDSLTHKSVRYMLNLHTLLKTIRLSKIVYSILT